MRPGTCATGDRFVVAEGGISEGEVVGAALRRCTGTEGPQNHVHHPLGGEHVAADHGGIWRRVEDGAGWDADVDRVEAALVERNVLPRQAPQHVDDRREGDGRGGVGVAQHLRPSAREVHHGAAGASVDGHGELDGRPVVHEVGGADRAHLWQAHALGEAHKHGTHGLLCIGLNVPHVRLHHLQPVLLDQLAHQRDALAVGSRLRLEVRDVVANVPRARAARVRRGCAQRLRDGSLLEGSVPHQLERDDGSALLPQVLRLRGHGAGRDAANVGVVAARCDPEHHPAAVEDGRDDRDVRQVGAARQLRVVGHQHIPVAQVVPPVVALEPHRLLHGAKVHGDVGRVGHQTAVGREERAREVESLLDVDADAGALQRATHLLRDAHEAVREDGQLDGVQCWGDAAARAGGGGSGSGGGGGGGGGAMGGFPVPSSLVDAGGRWVPAAAVGRLGVGPMPAARASVSLPTPSMMEAAARYHQQQQQQQLLQQGRPQLAPHPGRHASAPDSGGAPGVVPAGVGATPPSLAGGPASALYSVSYASSVPGMTWNLRAGFGDQQLHGTPAGAYFPSSMQPSPGGVGGMGGDSQTLGSAPMASPGLGTRSRRNTWHSRGRPVDVPTTVPEAGHNMDLQRGRQLQQQPIPGRDAVEATPIAPAGAAAAAAAAAAATAGTGAVRNAINVDEGRLSGEHSGKAIGLDASMESTGVDGGGDGGGMTDGDSDDDLPFAISRDPASSAGRASAAAVDADEELGRFIHLLDTKSKLVSTQASFVGRAARQSSRNVAKIRRQFEAELDAARHQHVATFGKEPPF
mmetsp:Transcript_28908/g.94113  ORF Transcript_28908/g.94113 Transcript_28908/m.94113 type:complete len:805 (-) Transcript_28908:45-2459(-)